MCDFICLLEGLVTVRRDNCRLVVTLINTCLQKLLIERDVEAAITYAKTIISDLLQDRVDISQLVITKAYSKTEYVDHIWSELWSELICTELTERSGTRGGFPWALATTPLLN